jgi:lipid phosphate phosphatase-related protein type 3/4
MVGEGILYCCLSKRRNGAGLEPNINAGGCNFNSFLRRAVRFVGGCEEPKRMEMLFVEKCCV